MKHFLITLSVLLSFNAFAETSKKVSDEDLQEAYNYFLGRLLVLRQEHIDFKENGYKWNVLFPREVGKVTWANPNLDVAYSEAWLALDKNSCAQVEIPEIKNRYYTFQVLNSWGETVSNINERTFPKHPSGRFAYCTKDSVVKLPLDVEKIPVEGSKFRVLTRVELGKDSQEAIRLQKQIKLTMLGTPQIVAPVEIPLFTNQTLIGVEAFDKADEILATDPDINPGMSEVQDKVKNISASIKNDPEERVRVDQKIKQTIIPNFQKLAKDFGKKKNNWMTPENVGKYGKNFQDRTLVNFEGIWANSKEEAVYFVGAIGPRGQALKGENTYSITFPKKQLPQSLVKYFWSVTATDTENYHVLPNDLKKYQINNHTKLLVNKDGSVTIVLAPERPQHIAEGNWLPTSKEGNFQLTFRMYGLKDKSYFPPIIQRDVRIKQAQEEK